MKVVQYLVKEVNQFPSDIECMRYIATIADKVTAVIRRLIYFVLAERAHRDL